MMINYKSSQCRLDSDNYLFHWEFNHIVFNCLPTILPQAKLVWAKLVWGENIPYAPHRMSVEVDSRSTWRIFSYTALNFWQYFFFPITNQRDWIHIQTTGKLASHVFNMFNRVSRSVSFFRCYWINFSFLFCRIVFVIPLKIFTDSFLSNCLHLRVFASRGFCWVKLSPVYK